MKRFMMLAALVACTKAEPPTTEEPGRPGVRPRASDVAVELAGVTLAEDCADGVRTKPLSPPAQPQPKQAGSDNPMPPAAPRAESRSMVAPGACGTPGGCGGGPPAPACDQTAMQLSVKMPDGGSASTIKIKKVELLDDTGKTVATLTARAPTKWDGNAYATWDEAIPAGKADHVVSYKLTAPDWNTLTNGRWNAPSKRFNLRVTVTIGNRDKTIEKQSIQPATPEPHVVT